MNIYNQKKYKDLFLEQFKNKQTKEVYTRIFKKSSSLEEKLNLDLFDFNDEQLENVMHEIKPKTRESARTYCNIISSYLQWAIDNRYSKHFYNPFKRRQDFFYNFVDENKLYFSFDEKESILAGLYNPQDQFIVQALFEGIEGKRVSNLINLKVSDLIHNSEDSFEDYIDYSVRILNKKENIIEHPIAKKTYDLGISANRIQEYYKRNGEVDYLNNVSDVVILTDSEYVLKKTNTNSNNNDTVSHYTVYNRLEMMRKLEDFHEFKECFTTKNIVRSGMIYWAKKIYDRCGMLEKPQVEEICERFDIAYKWSLREDFLNIETVRSLYGEEKL